MFLKRNLEIKKKNIGGTREGDKKALHLSTHINQIEYEKGKKNKSNHNVRLPCETFNSITKKITKKNSLKNAGNLKLKT